MTPHHLVLVDAEIARAPDRVSADCLRAKRAAYLVRQGHLVEANVVLTELRARYSTQPNASISSWLNFVDGLSFVFEGREVDATDKMQRAHALASAISLSPMRSLCAGWLANLKFGVLDVEGMSERLDEAFRYASDADHQALSRACLVCAVALHFGNRYDLAKPWYRSARAHAAEEADEATVSALIHNIACIGVSNLRQMNLAATAATPSKPQAAPDALLEADSTINYDNLVGTASASTWAPILKAQALSLRGEWTDALGIYEEHIELSKSQGLSRVLCYMYADMAWCQVRAENSEKATESAELAAHSFSPSTLIDDRAAAHSRLAGVFELLGRSDESRQHSQMAADAWSEFELLQRTIVSRLQHLVLR